MNGRPVRSAADLRNSVGLLGIGQAVQRVSAVLAAADQHQAVVLTSTTFACTLHQSTERVHVAEVHVRAFAVAVEIGTEAAHALCVEADIGVLRTQAAARAEMHVVVLVEVGQFDRVHHAIADAGKRHDLVLHLGRFDAHSGDLDLVVGPAQVFEQP